VGREGTLDIGALSASTLSNGTAKIELREPAPRHSDAAGAFRCALRTSGLDLRAKVGRFSSGRLCRERRLPAGIAQPAFKTFVELAQAIAHELAGRSVILDGEIVRPGPDGRPMFYELMPLIHEMSLSVRRCWLAANGSSVDAGRGRQTPWRGGAGRAPNGERSNSLEAAAASFSGLRTPESRIGAAATHADAKYVERFCKALNAFSECSCAFMVSSGRRRNHAIA